jgi:ribosomal protein L24E
MKNNIIFMSICENCENEHSGEYGSGRFCSSKCARGFSTKKKRKEINEKVSKTLTKNNDVLLVCENCNGEFTVRYNKRHQKTCSTKCSSELRWKDDEYRDNITNKIIERCSSLEERKRLRDIGRKGGFGKKGYTKGGIRYESTIECQCFEYLENNNILFETHKNIPNSSKVSDVYLPNKELWVEIDGINREKRKKWLGKDYQYWLDKIKHYKKEGLSYVIIYSVDELKNII